MTFKGPPVLRRPFWSLKTIAMLKFLRKRHLSVFVLSLAALFSSLSCEDKISVSADVLMETQKVGNEAGSQILKVQASGKWTLTLFFPDGEPWAELSVTKGSGTRDGIVLSYGENTGENRTMRIILTNNGTDAVRNFLQLGKDDAEQEADGVPGWMELPAVGESQDYYNHHFSLGGKKYRNYSFVWDKENILAHWVAYPLNKFYTTKSVDRTEDWNYDPKVPKEQQTDMYKGVGGGYDRGHQLPSADRLCNREANGQTFYFTNMTPQIGAFNQQIWSSLEGLVRSYSDNSDTLYVVTGCTLEGSPGKHKNKNDGKYLTVPGGYFKALLRYKKDGVGNDGYIGAAFFLEHRSFGTGSKWDWSPFLMSIDELEEMTGMDFFPNLKSRIGAVAAAEVEAEDPHGVSFWGIK